MLVLDEIISVLFSKPLVTELMKPQEIYSHEEVREIIEDVAHSSAMRLDPVSMNKLWELITMVYKWQITLSPEVVEITMRHLREVDGYVNSSSTHLQLQRAINIIKNFEKIFDQNEKNALREEILNWLSPFNVRVSLLLRMGLQNTDGTFVCNDVDDIAREMLNNLGENIYAVTQNGKALERCIVRQNGVDNSETEIDELKIFADQIVGEKKRNVQENALKLSINVRESGEAKRTNKKETFDRIEVDNKDDKMAEIIKELTLEEDLNESSLTDELLDMIESEN